MDSPAWLAWLLVVAALVVTMLLVAGRRSGRDEDLEAALRWQERQNRRARAASRAAAADRGHTAPAQPPAPGAPEVPPDDRIRPDPVDP